MDTMIFCHECKIDEMIDLGDAEDWRCPKCNQPERSKREESHKLVYREPNPETMSDAMKAKYEKAKAICGALNIVETQ